MKFGKTIKKASKKAAKKTASKSKFGRAVHPDFEGDETETEAPVKNKAKKSAMTVVSASTPNHGDMSALITDTRAIEQELKDEMDRRGRSQLWRHLLRVEDGTPKRVWFRSAEPMGALHMHRVPNGRQTSDLVPCSEHTLGECEFCAHGIPRSFYFVYDVVDVDGYYNRRQRKNIKNEPCYYLVSTNRKEAFDKQLGDKASLIPKRLVEIERIGSGPQTMHLYKLTKEPVPSAAMNKDSMEKHLASHFSVIPIEEQQRLLRAVNTKSTEDSED